MGIFLSITNGSRDLTQSQKFYSFTTNDSNEIIIDPSDFPAFVKTFRGLQSNKEDNQIELHNVVLEWKSRLRLGQETQETRNKAYELIENIEGLHDEQDAILESEKKKLDLLVKERTRRDSMEHERTHGQEGPDADFDEMRKEISMRQQYLRLFNIQSTTILKFALTDIELCQKMVDYSKDFKEIDADNESSTDDEKSLTHAV